MGTKKTKKPKRTNAKPSPKLANASPIMRMATGNLTNMVVVGVSSGAVLLTLLAAKHF